MSAIRNNWKVVVGSSDDSQTKVYVLPPSTPISQVLEKFTSDIGLTPEDGRLIDGNNSPIANTNTLEDVGEIVPGQKLVTLTFQTDLMRLEVLGDLEGSWEIGCRREETAASLIPGIQAVLGSGSEDRAICLRSGSSVLDFNKPLDSQLDSDNTVLVVELGMRLEVLEVWDGFEVALEPVFPSNKCDDIIMDMWRAVTIKAEEALCLHEVLSEEENDEDDEFGTPEQSVEPASLSPLNIEKVHISHQGSRIVFQGDVLEALMWYGAPWQRSFNLSLETQRPLAFLCGSGVEERLAWPSDRMRRLTDAASVMCDDRELSGKETAWELDLAAGGIVIEDPILVTLSMRDGTSLRVRTPKWATIKDLQQIASDNHHCKQLRLRSKKTILRDAGLTLAEAGIQDGSCVIVEANSLSLTVTMGEKSWTWRPDKSELNFIDLVVDLAALTKSSLCHLMDVVFQCTCCGRRIWMEQAGQTIPANCCSMQSRRLSVWTPPREDRWTADEMKATWALKVKIAKLTEVTRRLRAEISQGHMQRDRREKKEVTDLKNEIQLLNRECANLNELLLNQQRLNDTLKVKFENMKDQKVQQEEEFRHQLEMERHNMQLQSRSITDIESENIRLRENLRKQDYLRRDLLQDCERLKDQSEKQDQLSRELTRQYRMVKENLEAEERKNRENSQLIKELKKPSRQARDSSSDVMEENKALRERLEEERKKSETLEDENSNLNGLLGRLLGSHELPDQSRQSNTTLSITSGESVAGAIGGGEYAAMGRPSVSEHGYVEVLFYIVNYCADFNERQDFSVVLRLTANPTVGKVRAAIARHMNNRRADKIKLRRCMGTVEGDPVFLVGEDKFADVGGVIRSDCEKLKPQKWKPLNKDNELFPVVPGQANYLTVSRP